MPEKGEARVAPDRDTRRGHGTELKMVRDRCVGGVSRQSLRPIARSHPLFSIKVIGNTRSCRGEAFGRSVIGINQYFSIQMLRPAPEAKPGKGYDRTKVEFLCRGVGAKHCVS
ncbi:MAG: hypothetical protein EBE86_003555 [Hormoscilla sp. GUM202]|nr:hypothetical protein [Hormoscilla sp. GM7CHS1pb]MBO1346521.1 hypothetical protein [Hormoscilla sp. GUM202]